MYIVKAGARGVQGPKGDKGDPGPGISPTDLVQVVAVSAAIPTITTVAGSLANVQTVASNLTDITTVATAAPSVELVAPHVSNIDLVAPHLTTIDTVASHVVNVDTVASNIANVDAVAADIANVDAVADNLSIVNSVAQNMAAIQGASGQALAAATSASNAAASRAAIDNRLYPGLYSTPPLTRPDTSAIQDGDQYQASDGPTYVRVAGVWSNQTQAAAASAAAASVSAASAGGYASSASASSAQASTAATAALAAGHIYASTAAAQADATLPNGGYYAVVTSGALSAELWQKTSSSASVDQNFAFPAAAALQLSSKLAPTATAYGEVDQYGFFTRRVDNNGVQHFGALQAERTFQGVLTERVNEVLAAALRNARKKGQLKWPADVCIVLKSGQSNSEGAFAVPVVSTAAVPGIMMMDAIRGRFFAGTRYLNGLTPAIEVVDTDGTFNFGETGLRKACETVFNLVELENDSPYRSHGKILVPLSIGHSSSDVTAFDYGTTDFTLAINTCNAIKAWCDARGLTCKIIGGIWAWGANGYQNNITSAQWKSKMLTYFANVDTYLGSIFGQHPNSIPWGLEQTNAHNNTGNFPYGAEAEAELVEANTWIDIINPEGPQFLEVSNAHHSAREECILGGQSGRWLHQRCLLGQKWDSLIPALSRLDSNTVRLTLSLFPGFRWDRKETGLIGSKRMQPLYATMLYDPAAPSTALAQSRQPRITNDEVNGLTYIDIFATNPLPVNTSFRYSGGSTFGNFVMVPKPQLNEYQTYLNVNGVQEPIERWMPIVDRAVP